MVKLTEDHDLFGKCNIIWNKVSVDIKTNLIANLPTKFFFLKTKIGSTTTKKFLRWALMILVVMSLNSALKKDKNY